MHATRLCLLALCTSLRQGIASSRHPVTPDTPAGMTGKDSPAGHLACRIPMPWPGALRIDIIIPTPPQPPRPWSTRTAEYGGVSRRAVIIEWSSAESEGLWENRYHV